MACDHRGCGTSGFTFAKKPYSSGAAAIQSDFGISVTRSSFTIDFTDLNPYFHGATSRTGAPLCGGNALPYRPVAIVASGFRASSRRSPSTYGQLYGPPSRCPGISSGRFTVSKRTNFASLFGTTASRMREIGNPCHGITIDHPSTHRNRYTRSSGLNIATRSSVEKVRGFSTSPPTDSVHGDVVNFSETLATRSLSVENS